MTKSKLESFRDRFLVALQWACIIGVFLIAVNAVPNVMFRHVWFDLESVTVADHRVGENPQVTAWREIKREVRMHWSITVREYGTAQYVDSFTHPVVNYDERANSKNPLRMPLGEWIDVPGAMADLESDERYGAGTFYIVTCHHKLIWKACTASEPYERSLL